MKGEEISIRIGVWLMGQAAEGATGDAGAEATGSVDAMRSRCAQELGFEDNAEFQAFFKIVHQLWASKRLEMMMAYWENRAHLDSL